ncbi:MAG: ABC transporter ATP-binding protein [candidate division Zixibacteria bacterium]
MSSSILLADTIEVVGLEKKFGDLEALRGVDLSVKSGIIHAVVGPDGAGKTTLLRILAGIMSPTGGKVKVLGRDVASAPESIKGKIGYLSQRFSLNPSLTVEENIDFFASLYGVSNSDKIPRARRLLEFSRLAGFRTRRAAHLSGGMKQKLSLCCALIHTPELLLLDEPTTGVDPISRRELWEILYDLLGEGVTVIVSTPYMDEAERAGEITLLHKGRAIITGNMKILRSRYRFSMYELITGDNLKALETSARILGDEKVSLFGNRIHVAIGLSDDLSAFKSHLQNEGIQIKSIRSVEPGLEDIFIQELADAG